MSTRASFSMTRALFGGGLRRCRRRGGRSLAGPGPPCGPLLFSGLKSPCALGAAGHLHHGLSHLGLLLALVFFKLMTLGALYRIALFGKDARKEGLGPWRRPASHAECACSAPASSSACSCC
ncbi:MAG: hypothetical protein WDN06_01555 [Asticcacaulis sp.]